MAETAETIIVEVELPGVERNDVRIEVEGDVLRISGERHTTVEHQERQYSRIEQSYGRFERRVPYQPLWTVKGSVPSSRRVF